METKPDTVRAALCYLPVLNIVFFVSSKDDRFVRFHAIQSILLNFLWLAVIIVFAILFAFAGPGFEVVEMGVRVLPGFRLLSNAYTFVRLFMLAVTIVSMAAAYKGYRFKIPPFGTIAARATPRKRETK